MNKDYSLIIRIKRKIGVGTRHFAFWARIGSTIKEKGKVKQFRMKKNLLDNSTSEKETRPKDTTSNVLEVLLLSFEKSPMVEENEVWENE